MSGGEGLPARGTQETPVEELMRYNGRIGICKYVCWAKGEKVWRRGAVVEAVPENNPELAHSCQLIWPSLLPPHTSCLQRVWPPAFQFSRDGSSSPPSSVPEPPLFTYKFSLSKSGGGRDGVKKWCDESGQRTPGKRSSEE